MLNGLVVAVSGGMGRIGFQFCLKIVENGGKVVIADVSSSKKKHLLSKLKRDSFIFVECDISDKKNLKELALVSKKKFGKIDAAIHCAYPVSKQWGAPFESLSAEGLKEDLFMQLGGSILFSQAMLSEFSSQGWGNLILISSIQGIAPPKFDHYEDTNMVSPIEYSAIKSGIISVTKYLAKYFKGMNIRVNCISPGGIKNNQPEKFLKKYNSICNHKGMLNAGDLNGVMLFLLSQESKYINGQNIIIDDGWSL